MKGRPSQKELKFCKRLTPLDSQNFGIYSPANIASDNPDARLICNLYNGSPVKPEAMWSTMKQLPGRIIRLLKNGEISDQKSARRCSFCSGQRSGIHTALGLLQFAMML
jgi:hypothetical protein